MEGTPEIDEEVITPKEVIEAKPPEPPPSPEPDAETEAWIVGKEPSSGMRSLQDTPARTSDAPAGQIDLSPKVSGEMERLWKQSVKDDGTVREHAGTLVKGKEGNVKLVNPVAGTPDSVTPNRDVRAGEQLIGTFHTHPYEDGTTGAAFSGEDIVYAINNGDSETLVQSGEDTFALVRTAATPTSVDRDQIIAEFRNTLFEYQGAGLPFTQALFETNRDLCQRYGLGFYAGKHGALKEVV
ncbi:MAG: hypothetical protein AB1817_03700 [Chloroflexota bacterium]